MILGKIIFVIHTLSIGFFLLGCLLPSSWLAIHLVAVPLVILQWWFNSNQCVLTQLQHKAEGRTLNKEDGGQFVRGLCLQIGLDLNDRQLMFVVYTPLLMAWGISWLRFLGMP